MANIAAHTLMFLSAVLFAIMLEADVTATMIIGLLLFICVVSLGRFMTLRTWVAVCCALCSASVAVPVWITLLPVLAADMGYRLFSTDVGRSRRLTFVSLPVIATFAVAFRRISEQAALTQDSTAHTLWSVPTFMCLALVVLTALAALAGATYAKGQAAFRRYRALADAQRERLRRSRSRISDMEAARSADMQRARLNERTRIAREIHDNVGHLLTRAIMLTNADEVVARSTGDNMHAKQFEEIAGALDEAMTMIRRSVHDLKDEGTDFTAMIEDATSVTGDARVQVHVTNGITQPPSNVAHCFAAVVREALTNTMRHSNATQVNVKLVDLPGLWQLIVQDNGGVIKRNARHTAQMRGIGLTDIEERARVLNGSAVCGPYGAGWRVFVSVPKESRNTNRVHEQIL